MPTPLPQNGATTKPTTERRKRGGTGMNDLFIGVFGVAFLMSFSLSFLHSTEQIQHAHDTPIHDRLAHYLTHAEEARKKKMELLKQHHYDDIQQLHQRREAHHDYDDEDEDVVTEHAVEMHAGDPVMSKLNCDRFGGPSEAAAQEMVYWEEIPSDAAYVSPFHRQSKAEERYMTFEPDGGGWNNIRMAMESTIGLAVAMGRTLVMPPQKKMYLLGKGKGGQQNHFGFADFFPIQELADEHAGLDIISMEEYLTRLAMKGKLKSQDTGNVLFPPGNRTNWDGIDQPDYDVLRGYLRNVSVTARWNPGQCLPAFPKSGDHKDTEMLQELVHEVMEENHDDMRHAMEKYIGNPVPVDGPAKQRLEENLAGRKALCVYDEFLQNQQTLHFQCNHKERLRMLVHFYAFLFFEDWREDLWMKRFVRDHIRYRDEIQCAGARLVDAVRQRSKQRGNADGIFDSFHVRRGDFQYKTTRISGDELYEYTKDELTPGMTIFIATDERDKSFFDPMKKHYDVVFLDDFMHLLKDMNTNYYGMIDQLVASRGRVFFGCFYSTFTGYINRIRGYHSVHERQPGYEDGKLPTTYYYSPMPKKLEMHNYMPLRPGFFNRENPTSWRDLDKGITTL